MRCMLALLYLSALLPAEVATPAATVLRPVANMYSKPDSGSDVVSQAIYGMQILVLEQQPGWAKVETPDRYTGWMPSKDFRPGAYAAKGPVVYVESLFANIYREPDVTKHAPVITVPYETRLAFKAEPATEEERWIQVTLVDGGEAWIQRGDVTLDPPKLAVAALPEFAKRFLGLTYTWGGTSTYGYDCSGFVQMLYRRAGVVMPRDAQPQADWTALKPVARPDLRPGDLLYFGGSASKITHTGMYIGNGKFINATTHEHPGVRIDHLEEPFWTKLLVAARRLK